MQKYSTVDKAKKDQKTTLQDVSVGGKIIKLDCGRDAFRRFLNESKCALKLETRDFNNSKDVRKFFLRLTVN